MLAFRQLHLEIWAGTCRVSVNCMVAALLPEGNAMIFVVDVISRPLTLDDSFGARQNHVRDAGDGRDRRGQPKILTSVFDSSYGEDITSCLEIILSTVPDDRLYTSRRKEPQVSVQTVRDCVPI